MSGVQNKNKMVVMKPRTPVAMALDRMPLAAMTLKKGTESRKVVSLSRYIPGIFGFFSNVSRCIESSQGSGSEEAIS